MDDDWFERNRDRLKFEAWMAAPLWERWLPYDPPEDSMPWLN
jgi:hypothetical protein